MQHTGFAFLHMELTVENPVLPATRSTPSDRSSRRAARKSRPGGGLIRVRVAGQDGTTALTYTPLRMVKCREIG